MRKIFAQWDRMNASLPADGQWLSREPPSRREIWLMPCCHRSHSSRCQKGMQHGGGIEWEEVRNIYCVRKGTRRRKLIDAVEMVVCGNSPEEFGKRLPSCTGKTRQNPHNDEDRGQSQPPTPPHPILHYRQNRCLFIVPAKQEVLSLMPKMARHQKWHGTCHVRLSKNILLPCIERPLLCTPSLLVNPSSRKQAFGGRKVLQSYGDS